MDMTSALNWAESRADGILITIRKDGRPQSSDIVYSLRDGVFEISLTDSRAKTKNMRRDNRAVLHITDRPSWSYLSFDGTVELTPVTTDVTDATSDALVGVLRARRRQAASRVGRISSSDGGRRAPAREVDANECGRPDPLTDQRPDQRPEI